jgi:hypothetical protein
MPPRFWPRITQQLNNTNHKQTNKQHIAHTIDLPFLCTGWRPAAACLLLAPFGSFWAAWRGAGSKPSCSARPRTSPTSSNPNLSLYQAVPYTSRYAIHMSCHVLCILLNNKKSLVCLVCLVVFVVALTQVSSSVDNLVSRCPFPASGAGFWTFGSSTQTRALASELWSNKPARNWWSNYPQTPLTIT